jgi:hypothetical protein
LQLFFTSYKVIDGDALQAERYVESILIVDQSAYAMTI